MASIGLVALEIAVSQLGVHEQGANNSGPEVDQYLAAVGLPPGFSWCAAFVYWCFREACRRRPLELAPGVEYIPPPVPCPRTAGAVKLWTLAETYQRVQVPAPGLVYVLDHGGGKGHAGIVESVSDGMVVEISGNTNAAGSREGNCVARHAAASPAVVHGGRLLGYIDCDAPLARALVA